MRLCRIHQGFEDVVLAFYYDDYAVPVQAVYGLYRGLGYGSAPLFPCPKGNPLAYLPPNWEAFGHLSLLAGLAEMTGDDEELRVSLDETWLATPIPLPNKVICLAGNYAEHVEEGGGTPPGKEETFPFFFMKPPSTTVRPAGSAVALPGNSPDHIDWEVELGVVIGSYVKNITPDEADEAIAGYTIGLDMSNRRLRLNPNRKDSDRVAFHEWLCGKWHDGFAPIGPCLVPAEEDFDPMDLDISLSVNGEVMQDSNTENMIFDVWELVSYASQIMSLEPGDIILTGTPSGVGDAKGRYLKQGDLIEATIESIGTLAMLVS